MSDTSNETRDPLRGIDRYLDTVLKSIWRHVWLGFYVLFLIPAAVILAVSGLPLTLLRLWMGL